MFKYFREHFQHRQLPLLRYFVLISLLNVKNSINSTGITLQIFDAGDFSVLCSITAPRGERWMAGDFLAADRVILWSDEGHGYLYKLPAKYVRIRSNVQ